MIQGYLDPPSVFPGDMLTLHISTDAPQFRVDFYRQGETLVFLQSSPNQAGQNMGQGTPDRNCRWPRYAFPVPEAWASGAYIAILVECDTNGNQTSFPDTTTADGRDAKALFVVKNPAPGTCTSILYKLSLFTYHAYNFAGSGSLYNADPVPLGAVTLLRPGGGTGGPTSFPPPGPDLDVYDPSSPRGTFAHWDVPFIAWLEANGYEVDYCTDLDLHNDSSLSLLGPYDLLLSVGHDEYWTGAMRANLEAFIQNGGNAAFFSGNTCWWHIEFLNPLDTSVFAKTGNWWNQEIPMPENLLTGGSTRNGGIRSDGARDPVGYTVHNADHWVYANTGLVNGATFGDTDHLVGYECDGASLLDCVNATLAMNDGTPPDFLVLGVGGPLRVLPLDAPGVWSVALREQVNGDLPRAATMGIYTNTGTVFAGGTTDWARVLGINKNPAVEQITQNVLYGLSGLRHRIETVDVTQITGRQVAGALTSWQTQNGSGIVEHLAGASPNGDILEFFRSPQADWQVVDVTQIAGRQVAGALTNWQTQDGPGTVEHLAGLSPSGDVLEFFRTPQADWQVVDVTQTTGRQVAGPLTSWQTQDGPGTVEHLAGLSPTGDVLEFFRSPQADWQVVDVTQTTGRQVAGPLTSWQTQDGTGTVEHLAGLSPNGDVLEFYRSAQSAWQTVDVTQITGQTIASALTSWQVSRGSLLVEKLACSNDRSVYVFSRSPARDWRALNVTLCTSQQIAGPLICWQTPDDPYIVEHLAGADPNGHLQIFSW